MTTRRETSIYEALRYLANGSDTRSEELMAEEKAGAATDKRSKEKTVKKKGLFARYLERIAEENKKSGGQICGA